MQVIQETIGNTTILIQTMDEELEIVGEKQTGRATRTTGIADQMQGAYANVKSVIKTIASDIGAELSSIQVAGRPKEVEMEFNLGISAQAGPIWLVSGGGEYALKVKMIWELGTDD